MCSHMLYRELVAIYSIDLVYCQAFIESDGVLARSGCQNLAQVQNFVVQMCIPHCLHACLGVSPIFIGRYVLGYSLQVESLIYMFVRPASPLGYRVQCMQASTLLTIFGVRPLFNGIPHILSVQYQLFHSCFVFSPFFMLGRIHANHTHLYC